MQKKHIVLLPLFLCLITIGLPNKLYGQLGPQEQVFQPLSIGPSGTEQATPATAEKSELLPIEDTVSLSETSTQDPLSAFDEQPPGSVTNDEQLPERSTAEVAQIPLDDTQNTSPYPNEGQEQTSALPLEQMPQTDAIESQSTSPIQVTKKKNKKLSRQTRREKRKKEKLERQEQKEKQKAAQITVQKPDASLDFEVENQTGKTVYVTCLAYMKKRPFSRWRWDKSEIYKIDDNKKATIAMHPIDDEQDRASIFGYLAVLDNQKDADDAVYELLPDRNKLELDLLVHLKGKKIVLEVAKYGMIGEFFEYDFVHKTPKDTKRVPEVDFVVENKTGKTIHITCFVFQKRAKGTWLAQKTTTAWTAVDESRDDMSVWRFDKTPIFTLNPGESGVVDVDTIVEPRDRREVQGYLAIFDEDKHQKAEKMVFELLPHQNKLQLGKLTALKDKKVIIEIEKYGASGDVIDFTVKPVTRIDFTRLDRSKITKRSRL